jgi:hypothetical protein
MIKSWKKRQKTKCFRLHKLRFQLTPKICQKEFYDSSNLIIKNKVDFQNLDYNGLINLFKEVDLSKDKK